MLCNISEGVHDKSLCKENCDQNGKLFNHAFCCQYSLKNLTISSRSNMIKALIYKKPDTAFHQQSLWNRSNIEDQELVKFDLKVAQFKAMEIEVEEGRRAMEDLEQLKIELDEM